MNSSHLENAITKLNNHANLSNDLPPENSLLYYLHMLRTKKAEYNKNTLMRLSEDVVECLKEINTYYNGAQPENTSYDKKAKEIDRRIVYCISLILSDLFYLIVRSETAVNLINANSEYVHAYCLIDFSWKAVLSGDEDDIVKYFNAEMTARGICL